MKPPIPTEHASQSALFAWWHLAWKAVGCPDERLLYAIPNGGARHIAVAAKLKAEGVRAGIPDIALDAARGGFYGLRIEMKRAGEKPKPHQVEMIGLLRREGYNVLVCYSTEEAIRAISAYLMQPKT